MAFYVSAYDTEAVYPWWQRRELDNNGFSYTPEHIDEFVAGVEAVAWVHEERQAPATFFLVAKMLQVAGPRLRTVLDRPLFDIQCHSFTHPDLQGIEADAAALRHELVDSKKLIEDTFGRPVVGLTAPGGYSAGFSGHPRILQALCEAGYTYVRSVGAGPGGTVPAPLNGPFWYAEDGFPDLLETPSHAWHDNILTGQPANVHWPPVLPWDYPSVMPTDAEGVYQAYAPGIDHCVEAGLLYYLPIFHPWSIYRVDAGAGQIARLLDHAEGKMGRIDSTQLCEHIRANPALADAEPHLEG